MIQPLPDRPRRSFVAAATAVALKWEVGSERANSQELIAETLKAESFFRARSSDRSRFSSPPSRRAWGIQSGETKCALAGLTTIRGNHGQPRVSASPADYVTDPLAALTAMSA